MNIFGDTLDAPDRVFNLCAELRSRRKRRIAQPIMAYHPFFGGVSNCPRFQLSHRPKRVLDSRVHFLEEILRKFHPADVERKIKIAIAQEISLETLPERRRSHCSEIRWLTNIKRHKCVNSNVSLQIRQPSRLTSM